MAGKREWTRKVKTYQVPTELFTERPFLVEYYCPPYRFVKASKKWYTFSTDISVGMA